MIDLSISQISEFISNWRNIPEIDRQKYCEGIIQIASKRPLSIGEIGILSRALASSGRTQTTARSIKPVLDICSTGGGNSLTTLLSPYLAATQNISLLQLSVPGEIAGGIDTIGTIPEFRFRLTPNQIQEAIAKCGIAFSLNSDELAPADLYLFKKRETMGAKTLPDLIIASLLSKKLATGVEHFVVDVRVGPHGNFGHTMSEAKSNCEKIVSVAKSLRMECVCVMTNCTISPMPYFGRLENLEILNTIAGNEQLDEWTNEHLKTCVEIAALGVSIIEGSSFQGAVADIECSLEEGKLMELIKVSLLAQGSSLAKMRGAIKESNEAKTLLVKAYTPGYMIGVDYPMLRKIFRMAYNQFPQGDRFKSPIGLKLMAKEGGYMEKGSTLMRVRVSNRFHSRLINITKDMAIVGDFMPRMDTERIYGVIKSA